MDSETVPWVVKENAVWVLCPKSKVSSGELTFGDRDNLLLFTSKIERGGVGLHVFTDQALADMYIRDGKFADYDALKLPDFAQVIDFWSKQYPSVTHVIYDHTFGDRNIRFEPIGEVIRGRPI